MEKIREKKKRNEYQEREKTEVAGFSSSSLFPSMGGSNPGWNHLTWRKDQTLRITKGASIVKDWEDRDGRSIPDTFT